MQHADLDEQYARFPEYQRAEVLKFVAWTRAQPHMQELLEAEALLFYHACHGSLEQAKQILDVHLTVRTHVTEFFSDTDPQRPELKRAMQTIGIIPLPQCTPDGQRVVISRINDPNAANFNFSDALKLYFMMFDMIVFEDGIRIGDLIVIDMKGCTLGHVGRLGVMQMKKFLYYLQEAVPIRIAGLHFVNIVPFMDKVMALMTPFMKRELKDMLFLHNTIDDLHKYVPKEMLPKEYGGTFKLSGNEITAVEYAKLVKCRDDILVLHKRLRINEKLRPGKPKNATDLFGIEGNFKKLDID